MIMEFDGFSARVEFDPNRSTFIGHTIDTSEPLSIEGRSVDELRVAMSTAIAQYLAVSEAKGLPTRRQFSGKFLVRSKPDLHRSATLAAERAGISLNTFVIRALQQAIEDAG